MSEASCQECENKPCDCESLSQSGSEASGTESSDDGKGSSGYSPCLLETKSQRSSSMAECPATVFGRKARERRERTQGTSTSNLSWHSARRNLLPQFNDCLDEEFMPSYQEVAQRRTTSVKRPPEMVRHGSMELNPFDETMPLIGSVSGILPKPEILMEFRLMYVWSVIVPFERSKLILRALVQLNEKFGASGVLQQLANQDVLGNKQEWMLTLSVRGPSSGLVTQVRRKLCLMNFVEVLTSPTCYDGWTGIRSIWKSRELADPWMLSEFGLPPISIPATGIPDSTEQPMMP